MGTNIGTINEPALVVRWWAVGRYYHAYGRWHRLEVWLMPAQYSRWNYRNNDVIFCVPISACDKRLAELSLPIVRQELPLDDEEV